MLASPCLLARISDIRLRLLRSKGRGWRESGQWTVLLANPSLLEENPVQAFLIIVFCSHPSGRGRIRVSSKQTKINFGSNRNKPKQDLFRVCFGLFRETKKKNFGLFRCFEPILKQRKQTDLFRSKPKQTETNSKFYEKFPNILSFKLFGWVFCLFWFNRNSLFWYKSETTETNRKN
jgi:hypothetical protein